jgi:cytoskeletal protein CcmA (bactofilin family)
MNDPVNTNEKPTRSLDGIPPVPTPGSAPIRATEPRPTPRSVGARMTVGPGINLKGEISDCDTLVVEGTIDATLVGEILEVSEGGTFTGTANVAEAEINGRFEGELTVTGVLQIRSGGHVTGTVKYGRIEVESGGEISGSVTREDKNPRPSTSPISAPRRDSQPTSN